MNKQAGINGEFSHRLLLEAASLRPYRKTDRSWKVIAVYWHEHHAATIKLSYQRPVIDSADKALWTAPPHGYSNVIEISISLQNNG